MLMRQIELCNNSEWLTLYGSLSDLPGNNEDDKSVWCQDWWSRVCNSIESLFSDVEVITPRNQRILYHGWNGANIYERKTGALLTFAKFTKLEWNAICAIVERETETIISEASKEV